MSPPKRQTVSELRALQHLMAQAVMRPLTNAERMRPEWSDGRPTKKIAATFIKPNDRLTSFERLEIYNRQYWLRVMDCFAEDYAGVRAVLGEGRFRDLAIAYIANHPSRRFTLRDLGSRLVQFIQDEPRWTAPHQELSLEMAQLEWAHIEAFDSEAKPPVTAAELAGRNATKIRLKLQPYISLLKLGWPLDDYLIALRENSRLRGEASNAIANGPLYARTRRPRLPKCRLTHIAVHRYKNVVYYKRLTAAQYEVLAAIQRGASLERALRALPEKGPARSVGKWFQNWSGLGWFWI
jgi:hypothetical protein